MRTTIIEEGIYDINTRESIKKAIFTINEDGQTRQLIGYKGKFPYEKIDRINMNEITTKVSFTFNYLKPDEIDYDSIIKNLLEDIKNRIEYQKDSYERNIKAEMPFFDNPIVIELDE
jgi:hypothetical protein